MEILDPNINKIALSAGYMQKDRAKRSFKQYLYENSLTLVFMVLFFLFLGAQAIAGWKERNEFLQDKGVAPTSFTSYLHSGHFVQATFENWESEFLQMGLFVVLSVYLRQKGSSESKPLEGEHESDREPIASPGAPWPVRKGGIYLAVYKYSLSLVFFALFLFSLAAHFYGSWVDYNLEQKVDHKSLVTVWGFMGRAKFWFESFQNWQSEFLSVAAIVFLGIYLRQKGSPQSKPVDAPNDETEN